MADFKDVISDQQGWLEWLVSKIPGYHGYKDKEMRREADVLLREQLATELREQLSRAEDVTTQLLTGPGISQLDDMGQGNTRLQTLIDKVKTASQGYAGFFDPVRIKENELDALYEFDYGLLMQMETISQAIDQVQKAIDEGEGIPAAVRNYIKTVTDLSNLFDTRRQKMIDLA